MWNGATAIVAGVAAQLAADWLGDIGPFQLAMTLTALAGVLMLAWEENYGGAAPAAKEGKKGGKTAAQRGSADAAADAAAAEPPAPPSGLLGAWHAVWQSEELMLVR